MVEVDQIQTEVDQEAMEAFFRIHAEFWALNLEEVMDSERASLARQLLVDTDRRLSKKANELLALDATLPREEAARQVINDEKKLHDVIPQLAMLIAVSENKLTPEIHRIVEKEVLPRRQALRRVLCETHVGHRSNLVGKALTAAEQGTRLAAAVEALFAKQTKKMRQQADQFAPIALQRTRPVPSLHILTTESAGMTEGYVQSWVEEEMALFNVIRAHGLEEEVSAEIGTYRQQTYGIGKKVIHDLGMDVVVEEVMAE